MRGADLSRPFVIAAPSGERTLGPADLPVRIGTGPAADIRVPGPVTGEILGLVGSLDGRPLLQATGAAGGPVALLVNGEPAAATRWLEDGDVLAAGALRIECRFGAGELRLAVSYADAGHATLPPVADGPPGTAEIAPARARPGTPAARRGTLRWSWFAWTGLALLATVALYLFTARAVRIVVEPASATVSLGGRWFAPEFGGRYLLRPGDYEVHAAAEGHVPQSRVITVGDAQSQEFRVVLEKLPGRLVLDTGAATPRRVTIDGVDVVPEAGGAYPAAAGSRRLEVSAERYLPFATTVEVVGRGVEQRIAAALTPNWADVTVASEPPGAEIRAGGASLGSTPATVAITAGTAAIELRKEGYKVWRQSLTLVAGQELELPLARLKESDGLLTVSSVPLGAAVTIDGRYRGVTPLEVEVAPEQAHELIVAKPGFETSVRSVNVARRSSAAVAVELAERLGVVRVVSDPPGAELWVNGSRRGETGQELTLPAVAQKIEVRKAGFAAFVAEVTPRPGMAQLVEARLLTPEQAVLASAPQTVTTKQGLVLRLVGAGAFRMGAARREQGRRPNEGERDVRITRRFYIATREVTNRDYREFKANHTSGAEKYRDLAGAEHPAVMLSWEDAVSYCNWLSDRDGLPLAYVLKDGALRLADPPTPGYRLPTEAEWEWASRYNGGGGAQRYPWGERMPPEAGAGNFADQSARGIVPNVLSAYDDRYPVTAPVGSFRPSLLGLFDLGGNAAEWTHDVYTVYSPGAGELLDPVGPASGQYHVIRGSSWKHASISELRWAYRDFGDQGRLDVGFRVARYAE